MTDRRPTSALRLLLLAPVLTLIPILARPTAAPAEDRLRCVQNEAIARKDEKKARAWHFGPQGRGDVYSTSRGHSNRLIPVYVFGKKADLGAVTGKHSVYRDPKRLEALYGKVPPNTLNPEADYCDQSDLYRVQKEAVERGARHLFIVWFDGMDWETTRAAAIARTGKVYTQGKGAGLNFLDESADGSAQYGFYVTSPRLLVTNRLVDAQALGKVDEKDLKKDLPGGYDVRFGGPNPWTPGPLLAGAPAYLTGDPGLKVRVESAGGVMHAVTDSAPSAAEFASGVKSFNDGLNVAVDGRFVPTLFNRLQEEKGWKVGTATSVPFNHASPAAMYAHDVDRDDFQDLAREMLGLHGIVQETGKGPRRPGLDVVLGTGHGQRTPDDLLKKQGVNGREGNKFITDEDKRTVDVRNGGKYVVVETTPGKPGAELLSEAASRAKEGGHRLFGLFGSRAFKGDVHLPYRTADGDYRPADGYLARAEQYEDDVKENPTLADMTRAALAVLAADRPFALFVEAGDVDFALHDNNLDNAIGAVHSGEEAVGVILDWIKQHSNWDDSVLIVAADHGHYLVLDDPAALAP